MIFQRLRVFVSSKMAELAPERRALKAALDALKVDAWVFEQDAGARPESIQKALIELRRRWTKPLRGRAGGRSPAIGDLPALISQLLFL